MANYWSLKHKQKIESTQVDAFLAEIHEVCKKHGFWISHEDYQGGFIIEKPESDLDFSCLDDAMLGESIE